MVNLPPDQPNQPDPIRPATGSPSQGNRILDFDELLAVVLAFVGIGSILWWGLSRNSNLWAGADLLQRRANNPPAVGLPEAEAETDDFEPRVLERSDRPREDVPDSAVSSDLDGETRRSGAAVRDEAVLVPAVPNTAPAAPATDAAETTQPLDISDVPPTHWAYPFIKPMFDQGYLPDFPESGFQPDQPLTRAELAALISQAFGDAPREGSVIAFTDVPDSYWAAPAIANAVSQNFMNGYPEGDFRPDQAVPRYEVLVSLATGLNLEPSPAPEQTLQSFVDAGPLPEWARAKVAAATENGLVVNYPRRDQLKPAQAATRAEIVAMIHQALVERGELPAVNSEYAVP
ncbi:S-layer homology domain-containing protein [Nodosilinea sp. AN01ver1]|uniref:S-layer homology domain-containing protein n=1 Tax=Nodosilinea sp. AN01ver1 TaxID=3423362 RepID=UPI003D31DDD7